MAADDEAVGLTVNGLIGAHAYSVLRAVEYNGKRFVVLRNPWGDSEWTGAWSDGSKEWTEEWLPALKALGHSFGEDGQFVMEYSDFLENWSVVERTLVFDDTWVMSSQWLQVTAREPTSAWSFGDISFTISIPSATRAVIVLSKLEERYFTEMSGNSIWMFDFVVFKKGSKEMLAQSSIPRFHLRSVNVELWLQRGDYVVHVRLDRQVVNKLTVYTADNADSRKLARVRAERAISQSIASSKFQLSTVLDNLPIPLEVLAGQDLTQLEVKAAEAEAALRTHEQGPVREKKSFSLSNTTGFPPTGLYKREMTMKAAPATAEAEDDDGDENWADDEEVDADPTLDAPLSLADEDLGVDQEEDTGPGADAEEHGGARREDEGLSEYSNDTVVLGLKVYTKKNAPATVQGQLRHEMDVSYAAFVSVALE
ncbi:unnamed protein product [Mycena citricolor]|uniref:Calpain catalytic domain-containing protein n=1 Tax=Mycena citricolor TaxID=2018698 RepID=A0AAD2K1J8_9AGAR|nr:unnamed protein product [Mycena citricolor]